MRKIFPGKATQKSYKNITNAKRAFEKLSKEIESEKDFHKIRYEYVANEDGTISIMLQITHDRMTALGHHFFIAKGHLVQVL